tara:strand:- start:4739 stop:6976 length:2238 start_codon:yes stop_codon:yes gene_type:complete
MKYILILITFLLFLVNTSHAVVVKDFKVKNNERITKETIITYGDIRLDKDYSQKELNKIIKDLYDTNFFKRISITIDGQTLVLDVEENKIIQTVKVEGVKSNKIKEAILKNLFSKDKSPFLIEKVKTDVNRMKTSLNNIGYYLSDVKSKISENNNGTVDLIFEVNLGEKSKIKKIEFIGDKKIKDRSLRSVIISEEAKFWKFISNNKFVNEDIIERDKRLLKNYYLSKGFYDVDVQSATVKFLDNKSFKLTYKINAGEIYTVNNTKLVLPIDYDESNFKDVKKELKKLQGKTYSINKISKVVEEIDKITLSREYDFINASYTENIIEKNKLNIVFEVTESEKFYVEKINIFGNNITHESVIRSKLEIDEGDAYNELLSSKSINNLKASNLFKNVNRSVKEGQDLNTKIIDITVDEKPTGEIMIGAGAGSDGGTLGFSISENNFLGKGVKLSSSLDLTEDSIRGLFSVTNPNFNYSDKSLSTSVESTNVDKLTDSGYKSTKTGFTFGTGFEQFQNVYFSPRLSNFYEDITTKTTASENLKKQSGSYFESKFSYGLDYDMRNQRFQTTDGFRSKFNQTIPLISEEYSFGNMYDFKTWYKLPNNMVTSFNVYGRAVNSLTGDDVKITNRFWLPRNKLKGFKTRNIGPVDANDYVGGNYAAAINFDTTLPMIFSNVQNVDLRYFLDTANLWGVDYSSSVDQSNTIRASTGVVVDWFTPIGPLNFSLAQDISKADDDKTESFQFNLGTTF